jgi:hypothetical protein
MPRLREASAALQWYGMEFAKKKILYGFVVKTDPTQENQGWSPHPERCGQVLALCTFHF